MPPRTLAIGDIHGCDVALDLLLERVRPAGEDTVVVLGDVVDRGPGTRQAIERLLALQNECRLVFLQGNHEDMMLRALDGVGWMNAWLQFGGREALASYGGRAAGIPSEHLEFLRRGLAFHETADTIFVHANLQPEAPLERQKPDWLLWKHLSGNERPHPSGKRVVCGHTAQRHGQPVTLDGWVCIDTFAHGGARLTCLEIGADTVWQTTQAGDAYGPYALSDIALPFLD